MKRALLAVAMVVSAQSAGAQRADTVVRNAGAPRYSGVATLAQEQSIGVVDGANEYMFAEIVDAMPSANGSLYVIDRGAMELRLYDSAGKYVRTIARRGQGPGDFSAPAGMAVLRDGRLLLYDSGNRRINVYSATGTVLTQWLLASSTTSLGRTLIADTAGFVHYRRSRLKQYPSQNMGGRPISSSVDHWFRVRTTDGVVVDSVAEPDWGPPTEPLFASSGRGWRQMAWPFRQREFNVMSPMGHLITGVSSTYAFEMVQPGRPIVSVRRNVQPASVTIEERRTARNYIEPRMREVNPLWTWPREMPTTKPVYRDISVGLDGRIWVTIQEPTTPPRTRSQPASNTGGSAMSVTPAELGGVDGEQPGVYDVFETDGAYVGRLQTPLRVFPLAMRGDYMWAVARDEDDVHFLRRYRIVWR